MNASERLLLALETALYDATTPEGRHTRRDAFQAIAWYVNTGRCSPAWVRSALRADPGKLLDRTGCGTVDEEIQRATAYLRRYCRLRD